MNDVATPILQEEPGTYAVENLPPIARKYKTKMRAAMRLFLFGPGLNLKEIAGIAEVNYSHLAATARKDDWAGLQDTEPHPIHTPPTPAVPTHTPPIQPVVSTHTPPIQPVVSTHTPPTPPRFTSTLTADQMVAEARRSRALALQNQTQLTAAAQLMLEQYYELDENGQPTAMKQIVYGHDKQGNPLTRTATPAELRTLMGAIKDGWNLNADLTRERAREKAQEQVTNNQVNAMFGGGAPNAAVPAKAHVIDDHVGPESTTIEQPTSCDDGAPKVGGQAACPPEPEPGQLVQGDLL